MPVNCPAASDPPPSRSRISLKTGSAARPLSVTRSGRRRPCSSRWARSILRAPAPKWMRVGKEKREMPTSDHLEIAAELPVRHRVLELPPFPDAGAHEVVD